MAQISFRFSPLAFALPSLWFGEARYNDRVSSKRVTFSKIRKKFGSPQKFSAKRNLSLNAFVKCKAKAKKGGETREEIDEAEEIRKSNV